MGPSKLKGIHRTSFTGSRRRSTLAHVWLDRYSRDNKIIVKADEKVIDEGENNNREYQKPS